MNAKATTASVAGADMLLDVLAEEVGAVSVDCPAIGKTKKCSVCGGIFPLDGFYKNSCKKDGRQNQCITCAKLDNKAQYHKRKAQPPEAKAKPATKKRCASCGEVLALTSFRKHSNAKDGYRSICKDCQMEANKTKAKAQAQTKASTSVEKTKHCDRCNQNKPIEQFPINAQARDGRHSFCKACMSEYSRAWRAKKDTDWEVGVALPEPISKVSPRPFTPPVKEIVHTPKAPALKDPTPEPSAAANRTRYQIRKQGNGPKVTVDFAACMGVLHDLKGVSEDEFRDLNSQILFACKSYLKSREARI